MNKDYTTYDAIELAADAWFLKWLVEGDPEAERFWLDWEKDHPDKKEVLQEAKIIANAIRFKEIPIDSQKINTIWQNIDTLTEEVLPASASPKKRPIIRWIAYAAAAASVALLAIFWMGQRDTTLIANNAEQIEYYLPDSSLIILNAGTKASFDPKTWDEDRLIMLDGEAFFSVQKGSKFTVQTQRGTVEVLGTSFNVNTHDGRFEVACYTGRVKVQSEGQVKESNVLTAGKRVSLNRSNSMMQADTFSLDKNGWFQGNIEFETAPLTDVFAEIERQFDVQIDAPTDKIAQEIYTGFLIRENLDSTLQVVCWPKGLEWEKVGANKVVIDYQ